MQDGAGCDVVLACGFLIWHLPTTEDEALLWRRNARLLLDFFLDSGDLITGIAVNFDLLACQGLYFDEHCVAMMNGG